MEGKDKIGEQPCSFSSATRIPGCCVLYTDVAARRLNIPEVEGCSHMALSMTPRMGRMARERPEWKRAHPARLRVDYNFCLSLLIHVAGLVATPTTFRWYKMIHIAGRRNLSPLRRQNRHNSMSSKQFTGNYCYMGTTDKFEKYPRSEENLRSKLDPSSTVEIRLEITRLDVGIPFRQ